MISDRIDELIALAALGELSIVEQHELDAAASSDREVAAELDEALAAAAAIQRPNAEAPPAALRNSVLAAIASTLQDAVETVEAHPGAETGSRGDNSVASLDTERARRRLRPTLLAAAAIVLFVVGGVVVVVTNDDTSDPIAAVVDAPDASDRRLTGAIDALTVTYSASEGALVVAGDAVPVLDDTTTYQLWLVGDDGATSVGIFRPDADGEVARRFDGTDPTGFVLGVTEEPVGGSDTPTLPILASA